MSPSHRGSPLPMQAKHDGAATSRRCARGPRAVYIGAAPRRLEIRPDNRICMAGVQWKGAYWWETLRGLLKRPAEPERKRLAPGHRTLGKRHWDDSLQAHVEDSMQDDSPWTWVAQDRERCYALKATFVAKVLRTSPKPQLPRTRCMMQERLRTDTARSSTSNGGPN